MKFSLYTGALALLATSTAASSLASFRREHQLPNMDATTAIEHARRLEIDEFLSFFLVSRIDDDTAWCITAAEGAEEFANLKLQPCDFEGAPANQRWLPNFPNEGDLNFEDFMVRSALDDSKCITVNHGTKIFDGARARLSSCENGLNVFYGDGYLEVHIRVSDDDSFCLTNRGPRPHPTDWIHVKPCMDRKDFFWEAVPHLDIPNLIQLSSGGGCAQPREGKSRVYLDECDEELAWRVSFEDEHELLHSPLDDDKCLRAGRGQTIQDGTKMTLAPCDPSDPLQVLAAYSVSGERSSVLKLHAAFDEDFCMVYRGNSANVGVDPIIMKTCNDNQEPWDVIEVNPYD